MARPEKIKIRTGYIHLFFPGNCILFLKVKVKVLLLE